MSLRDTYDRVHKKKSGEYVSERSKKVIVSILKRSLRNMFLNAPRKLL